jgi:hypothetical protein
MAISWLTRLGTPSIVGMATGGQRYNGVLLSRVGPKSDANGPVDVIGRSHSDGTDSRTGPYPFTNCCHSWVHRKIYSKKWKNTCHCAKYHSPHIISYRAIDCRAFDATRSACAVAGNERPALSTPQSRWIEPAERGCSWAFLLLSLRGHHVLPVLRGWPAGGPLVSTWQWATPRLPSSCLCHLQNLSRKCIFVAPCGTSVEQASVAGTAGRV